jgi:hypothetical protein
LAVVAAVAHMDLTISDANRDAIPPAPLCPAASSGREATVAGERWVAAERAGNAPV